MIMIDYDLGITRAFPVPINTAGGNAGGGLGQASSGTTAGGQLVYTSTVARGGADDHCGHTTQPAHHQYASTAATCELLFLVGWSLVRQTNAHNMSS